MPAPTIMMSKAMMPMLVLWKVVGMNDCNKLRSHVELTAIYGCMMREVSMAVSG